MQQKTISSLVHEQLKLVGKSTTDQEIKRVYHRNYNRRTGSGGNRFYIATEIVSYLITNKIV